MPRIQKACPVVLRIQRDTTEMLAFRHPSAGFQLVKGTIEPGETPADAAVRELREESGVIPGVPMTSLGPARIGSTRQLWHFFYCMSSGLPDAWEHETEDDHGHTFAFFWHPLHRPLDENWHPIFHEAHAFLLRRLPVR